MSDLRPMTDAELDMIRVFIKGDDAGPIFASTARALVATIDALRDQRHADEKHPLSQSPLEFVRSRNRKRSCDSDGFIGCERCQTMALCMDYESAEARAAAVTEALEKVAAIGRSAFTDREARARVLKVAKAALAPKKGEPK